MSLEMGIDTLFAVAVVSALAPILAAVLPGPRIPQVVFLILGGILIGPELLDIGDPASIELFANVGLGFLFLLAGYELEFDMFASKPGRLALVGWFVSVALAFGIVGLLEVAGFVDAFVPVSLALTTTALGTLLPILRESGMNRGPLSRYILSAGAVGELLPVFAIALFLSASSEFVALLSLLSVGVLALALIFLPKIFQRSARLRSIVHAGEHDAGQITVRFAVVLLMGLLAVAARFGLDVVLGAFLAGVVLRRWAPGEIATLEHKLDAIGFGFFIPIFFVVSGMNLDVVSVAENPLRLVVFFVLLVVVRGLPTLLIYRGVLQMNERVQLMLLVATGLPLLLALSAIGLANGTMRPENAAALVGAGVLSVLIFPTLATAMFRRSTEAAADASDAAPVDASPLDAARDGEPSSDDQPGHAHG